MRGNERGQAMVEFAMVVGLFLLCLLGAMSAAVYTVQRSAAVTGVTAGARIAAGGTAGLAGANTPNLAGAPPAVARIAAPVMVGTRIRQLDAGRDCPPAGAIPSDEVDVCAVQAGGTVTVRLRGRPAAAVPIPGLAWSLDLAAEVHAVTFAA
ncbi:MAG TPA: TadE family protein [Candidatus Dormibacteraeota bacterium]